jgi:hypothetical protein
MKRPVHTRRGAAALLAMIYLVLFSSLAVGFYATVNTQVQVAHNDQSAAVAYSAAESGMDFMRYQLANVSIPPATPPAQVLNALYDDLRSQMELTHNLGSNTISLNGNAISIPASSSAYVALDTTNAAKFRITITDWAGQIVVKSTGVHGPSGIARSIQMDFTRQQRRTSLFDYAVAAKGLVRVQKGTVTGVTDPRVANIMSALASHPSINMSGGTVGGDLNIVEDGQALVTGGSVGGSSSLTDILNNHVHVVDDPEFPNIDTSVYRQYAVNTGRVDGKLKNLRIPAGTNPKYTGNETIQGILYVESPNVVEFRGNVELQGFIVFENANTPTQNMIDFRGSVLQSPVPAGAEFDNLRSTLGLGILAPTTGIVMSGSTDSYVKGNVMCGDYTLNGAANITFDRGSLICLSTDRTAATFNGSKNVRFTATGKDNQPNLGLSYSQFFAPLPSSYQEVGQ